MSASLDASIAPSAWSSRALETTSLSILIKEAYQITFFQWKESPITKFCNFFCMTGRYEVTLLEMQEDANRRGRLLREPVPTPSMRMMKETFSPGKCK